MALLCARLRSFSSGCAFLRSFLRQLLLGGRLLSCSLICSDELFGNLLRNTGLFGEGRIVCCRLHEAVLLRGF